MTAILDAELSTGEIEGTGVFDQIMQANEAHLKAEYQAGRITGSDYTTVYLGSLQAAMQAAVTFILGRQTADKQADLLAEQILESQKNQSRTDAEIILINAQVVTQNSQQAKIAADIAAIAEKANLDLKQQLKMQAEIDLLTQRTKSEIANILDLVDGVAVTGTVGKQKALYGAQTEGFARDAEQRVLDAVLKTWQVRATTDEATTVSGNGLSDANIKTIVDKARAGIGLTPSS